MDEEEQFNQAFSNSILDDDSKHLINCIQNNNHDVHTFELGDPEFADQFTDQMWVLLGQYIANNTHLTRIDLDNYGLTNRKMALLFRELKRSTSLNRLDMDYNNFDINGLQCMVPFLQNSPQLSELWLRGNRNINTMFFELLIQSLNGGPLLELYIENCNITNISSLETYTLSDLQTLNLNGNKIGREGCRTLSKLLQKEGTRLTNLELDNTGINNEGAEILVAALENNTTLKYLSLNNNNGIAEREYLAFLKLLVDISSIDNTYKSNKTLIKCSLYNIQRQNSEIQTLLDKACLVNKNNTDSHAAGRARAKVIKYQLNSQNRKKICRLQGIEYTPGSSFADIEPTLLPQILALIGKEHGQSEFYSALIPLVPSLMSYIDRKALIDEKMAKNMARATDLAAECAQKVAEHEQKIAALKADLLSETSRLTAENNELKNRRTLIDLGDSRQSTAGEGEGCGGGIREQIRTNLDLQSIASFIHQLDIDGYSHIIHLTSFGGWNGPHLDTTLSPVEWYNIWQNSNASKIFHGIDFDLEGNDNLTSTNNVFTIDCLDLMGSISTLMNDNGYIVSIAPPQSYLNINNPNFSRYVNMSIPNRSWHSDFHYFGYNVYAYLLAKYGMYIDLISIQLYESWSDAGMAIYHDGVKASDYLYNFVYDLVVSNESYYVEFDQDTTLNMTSQNVSVPLSKLVIGLANGWAVNNNPDSASYHKALYISGKECEAAYRRLLNDHHVPRGFMYWTIEERGKNDVYLARDINQFLFPSDNDTSKSDDHDNNTKKESNNNNTSSSRGSHHYILGTVTIIGLSIYCYIRRYDIRSVWIRAIDHYHDYVSSLGLEESGGHQQAPLLDDSSFIFETVR